MSNFADLRFWLEQEPVDNDEAFFLPPDTPMNNPSTYIMSQRQKKSVIRTRRALSRLTNYHCKKLDNLQEDFAKVVDPKKLPSRLTPTSMEMISGQEYLNKNTEDLLGLIDYLRGLKDKGTNILSENDGSAAMLEDNNTDDGQTMTGVKDKIERADYQLKIEQLLNAQLEEEERRYVAVFNAITSAKVNKK
ncbi:hypothetical protein G6F37_003206 [Rhizopus arrhizus]|nr:hypothetical protein G6F38_003348 [Rhizopus arrhizus]KAG1161298.1 hypothetical protein G6F37_003206 [Rhizopus arrhizus]